METRNRVGIGLSYTPARQATLAGEIDSLESIPGLPNSLSIQALFFRIRRHVSSIQLGGDEDVEY
jgi:hypothetical protein